MKLAHKYYLISGLLVLLLLGVGVASLRTMRLTHQSLGSVYNDRVVRLKLLKAIADDYAVYIIDAANKANAGLVNAEDTLTAVNEASERIRVAWQHYLATSLSAEEANLAREATSLFEQADASVESFRFFWPAKKGCLPVS